jgi:hypothetical protein
MRNQLMVIIMLFATASTTLAQTRNSRAKGSDYGKQIELSRTIDEVDTDEVSLLGKPIENRVTGEVIGLACTRFVDEVSNCTKMRFVSFFKRAAFYFGPEFSVPNASEFESKTNEVFAQLKKKMKLNSKSAGRSTLYLLGAGGAGFYLLTQSFMSGVSDKVSIPLGVGIMLGLCWMGTKGNEIDLSGSAAGAVAFSQFKIIRDKSGWNWSDRTKKLSHKKFYLAKFSIVTYFESNYQEHYDAKLQAKVSLAYHTHSSCTLGISGSLTGDEDRPLLARGEKIRASDLITALSTLQAVSAFADQNGCDLTFDRSADYFAEMSQMDGDATRYQLSIRSRSGEEKLSREGHYHLSIAGSLNELRDGDKTDQIIFGFLK